MTRLPALLRIVVLAAATHSQSTPQQRHGINFGTFSNLRYIEEGGDVLGVEITILPQYETAYAIVQCAEGAPTAPVLVPIELKGNHFHFVLRTGRSGSDGDFSGTISQRGMTLHSTSEVCAGGFIPRRSSYWSR